MDAARFLTSAVTPSRYPPADAPEIAFYGRSNVGKSSLINALVRQKHLVKTGSTPGMTQTLNFFSWGDLRLVDLPGYGYAKAPAAVREQFASMIRSYLEARSTLKLVCLLLDIRRDPSESDHALAEFLTQRQIPTALVLTKADKESGNGRTNRRRLIARDFGLEASEVFLVSSQSGFGLDELRALIREAGQASLVERPEDSR